MQDIGIATGRPAVVNRPEASQTVYLEFRGTRDAPHVNDRDTRLRVSMPVARAAELRRQLSEVVPEAHEIWRPEILDILASHRGETNGAEDALKIMQRLSRYWR
jgi:hypothetical protein